MTQIVIAEKMKEIKQMLLKEATDLRNLWIAYIFDCTNKRGRLLRWENISASMLFDGPDDALVSYNPMIPVSEAL